jgi:hypothetical protein
VTSRGWKGAAARQNQLHDTPAATMHLLR